MPETIIEDNRIVVEDTGGTKIEIVKLNRLSCKMTFSGFIREGTRRKNVKKTVQLNELLTVREALQQILEDERFEARYEGSSGFVTSKNFIVGKFWMRFMPESGCYIGVKNTSGVRYIRVQNPELFFPELLRALHSSEDWFARFQEYDEVSRRLLLMID